MAPKVCILLLTYDRLEYAERTLRSVLEHIEYPEPISVHIADDGSAPGYREALVDLAGGFSNVQGVTVTNSQRGGYGRNYNLALQVVHAFADVVLPLEDDWEILRGLLLAPLVAALQERKFGCIRLGYVGWTQQLRGEFVVAAGQHFLALDQDSPEPHVWAGHPRLETREWQKQAGPWPEGDYDPGTTEFMVAQRPDARVGVVWPVDLVAPRGDLFAHIGTVQARTDQREAVTT